MVNPNSKDPGAWLFVVCGVGLLWISYPKFVLYLQTGYAFHRHTKSVPYDLIGGDAAAIHGIYLLVGVFALATGLRRLIFGK